MTEVQNKILDCESLAKVCETLRQDGSSIAHCHGVFDLLHIGHIRHFQAAKRMGQVLIVTLTGDKFVNKGPNRPAFPEELRAEALAALACVDFVAINQAQSAIPMIEVIQPAFYVKGSDYRQRAQKNTGNLAREIATVKQLGGDLAYTDDLQFSSSLLINRHFSNLPPAVEKVLAEVRTNASPQTISRLLDSIGDLRAGIYRLESDQSALLAAKQLQEWCSPVSLVGSRDTLVDGSYEVILSNIAPHTVTPTIVIDNSEVRLYRNGEPDATVSYADNQLRITRQTENLMFPLLAVSAERRIEPLLISALTLTIENSLRIAGFLGFCVAASEQNEQGLVTRPKLMRCVEALLKY